MINIVDCTSEYCEDCPWFELDAEALYTDTHRVKEVEICCKHEDACETTYVRAMMKAEKRGNND